MFGFWKTVEKLFWKLFNQREYEQKKPHHWLGYRTHLCAVLSFCTYVRMKRCIIGARNLIFILLSVMKNENSTTAPQKVDFFTHHLSDVLLLFDTSICFKLHNHYSEVTKIGYFSSLLLNHWSKIKIVPSPNLEPPTSKPNNYRTMPLTIRLPRCIITVNQY